MGKIGWSILSVTSKNTYNRTSLYYNHPYNNPHFTSNWSRPGNPPPPQVITHHKPWLYYRKLCASCIIQWPSGMKEADGALYWKASRHSRLLQIGIEMATYLRISARHPIIRMLLMAQTLQVWLLVWGGTHELACSPAHFIDEGVVEINYTFILEWRYRVGSNESGRFYHQGW